MTLLKLLPIALLSFCILTAAGRPSVLAAPPEIPGETETSWGVKLKKALNPSQKCPHCQQEFSANRSMWMLLVGFIGQFFFTSRFLVQWIASERRKESYIPHVFWYLSIIGSVMLLAYAVSIVAWPIILGQAFGVIVYGRNLALIARQRNREAAQGTQPDSSDR